jgi:polyisoprenoid-binding protein YceI
MLNPNPRLQSYECKKYNAVNHYVCGAVISIMKKLFTITLLLIAGSAFAQVKQTVTQSTVSFQIKNLGFNTHGTFGGLQADINFDPAKPEAGSISATIDANTINTDNDMRDRHLKEDTYFDVVKYPKISLKSISLKHKGGNNYDGQFSLTIKDKTQTVDIPFTYVESGNSAEFKGVLKIKRTDFNVGTSSMVMSNDVQVDIDVKTTK